MAEGLYCYQCEQAYPVAVHSPRCNDLGDRICPRCASDFIELRQDDPPDASLLSGLRSQLGLPQVEEPTEPTGSRPSIHHHNFVTPGGTRVAVSLTTTSFTADQLPTDGSNVIIAALSNAFGGQSPVLLNLGNLLGGNDTRFSMADFTSGELGLEHILQRLMDQYQPQATPASTSAVAALPRLKVSAAGTDPALKPSTPDAAACHIGDACTVCHDDFEEGVEVVQLPCKHCFHQDCLMPWLEMHNTCPVCRHALPVESTPRRTASRDPEELHHPAVEAALSGIGHGQASRQHNDPRADPFWQQQRAHRFNQDQQTQAAPLGVPAAQQAFQASIRQAMTNTVNLGNAAEAAQGIQELAQSLRLSSSGQWPTRADIPRVDAIFNAHGRAVHLPDSVIGPFAMHSATQGNYSAMTSDQIDDQESMPALLTDSGDESDEWDNEDNNDVAERSSQTVQTGAFWQSQHAIPSQPQPIRQAVDQHQHAELDSHPAGSSIDDIDIELPLIQDEYASSEDALEGTSGADEDLPSLLDDELASSGSEPAGHDNMQGRRNTLKQLSSSSAAAGHHASSADLQPDSSASSMTARAMLDPAQALDLPNKRQKRSELEASNTWSDSTALSDSNAGSAGLNMAGEAAKAQNESQPTSSEDRSFGGPFTWARRGAGALTSWALGVAGLR